MHPMTLGVTQKRTQSVHQGMPTQSVGTIIKPLLAL
jgi:hypothetical protein